MELTAVVLAGGKGTRFTPFVTNKTMWPLMGKPALEHTIRMLASGGIEDIMVVTNKDNEEFVRSYQTISPNLRYRLQSKEGGMDHALSTVSDLVGRRPVIVLNAIDFFENNLIKEYLQYISSRRPKVLMVGMETDSHLPLGYFKLTDGRVSGVIEKPARGSEPSNVVKMTFDYFDDPQEFVSLFDAISHPQGADMRYELALDILLKRYGADMIYTNSWSKLIYPHSVLDVTHALLTRELQEHIEPTAHVSPLASLSGPVYVDHDARIDAFAVIKGPTYIGRGVTIGSHTLIRQSMIEHGATVGYGSEVARSYVGPDCQLHHSFVGDSVLEREVNMSWGTVTTNLRFDRRSVRCKLPDGKVIPTDKVKLGAMIAQGAFLGANVTTMPGVCIGANSNILPGSLIR